MHNGDCALKGVQLCAHAQKEAVVQLLLLCHILPQLLGSIPGRQQPLRQRYTSLGVLRKPHVTVMHQIPCYVAIPSLAPAPKDRQEYKVGSLRGLQASALMVSLPQQSIYCNGHSAEEKREKL